MKIANVTFAIALLACLLDMPYGYYQLVRFVGMVFFGSLAYNHLEDENKGWFVFWLASAILINPIFKISLGREIWNVVDVTWAVVLVWTSLKTKR